MGDFAEGLGGELRCPSASFDAGGGDRHPNHDRLLCSDRRGARPADPTDLSVLGGTFPSGPCHGFFGLGLGPTWPRGARRVRWPNPRNRSEPRRDRPVVARAPRRPRRRPRASAPPADFPVVPPAPLPPPHGGRDAALPRPDG